MASAFHEETCSAHISPGLLLVDSRCICFRIMPRRSLSALFSWFLCPSIPEAVFLFFSQVNPAVSSKWPTQALGVQGQGCGLPGTSFLSPPLPRRGFGSPAPAAGPQSVQLHTAAPQSQGFRQALGACVPRGPGPCHEGGEDRLRLSLGWGWAGNMAASAGTCLQSSHTADSSIGVWILGKGRRLGQMKTGLLLDRQCSSELSGWCFQGVHFMALT